jgi:hypothetical protein
MTDTGQPKSRVADSTDEKKATLWGVFWWALSVSAHLIVIGAIIYFTPLREYFFSAKQEVDPLSGMDATQVRRVTESLVRVTEERVRDDIRDLNKSLAKLLSVRDTRFLFYESEAKRARGAGAADVPDSKRLSALGPTGPSVSREDPAKLGIFALYEMATNIELNCVGADRQMKAVELARIQSIDLSEAFDSTRIPLPVRPQINRDVFARPAGAIGNEWVNALRQELYRIRAETADMVSSVRRMEDIAAGLVGDRLPGSVVLLGSDLSVNGGGLRKWGASAGPSLSPLDVFPSDEGNMPANFLPPTARKMMEGGEKTDWMALDTWYIIGPFPNPKREYMDKKFPPESVIDLDAVYVGKNSARLQWEWTQASPYWPVAPRVTDSYAIWYGYTEVWSDKDQTKICLFGSDDYSKVWVNGELIYTSGKDPHHWIPDRGLQKVLFKKGPNPVLLKLENAGGTTGFSVCIYLGESSG